MYLNFCLHPPQCYFGLEPAFQGSNHLFSMSFARFHLSRSSVLQSTASKDHQFVPGSATHHTLPCAEIKRQAEFESQRVSSADLPSPEPQAKSCNVRCVFASMDESECAGRPVIKDGMGFHNSNKVSGSAIKKTTFQPPARTHGFRRQQRTPPKATRFFFI